jgi:membrane-bound serine protease (ClpP class)
MLLAAAILAAFLLLPPPWSIAVVVVAAGVEAFEITLWRRLLRNRVRTGAEALAGMTAEVVDDLDPDGRVRVRGELWNASSARPVKAGERVVVRQVDGLRLQVEPSVGEAAATPAR